MNDNQVIHEARGFCWHEFSRAIPTQRFRRENTCDRCGVHYLSTVGERDDDGYGHPDYATPTGFFTCWNWAKEQEWWPSFASYPRGVGMARTPGAFVDKWAITIDLIDPPIFAHALAEFLRREPC